MAGFTPFLLQLLALCLSTCRVSGHLSSSNQSPLSPLPLASSRSSSVALAFSCHSLQDSEQPSNTIVISPPHMSIPSESIRCCKSVYSFLQPQHAHLFFSRLSVNNFLTTHNSRHSSPFFLKLLFHFLLNTMPYFDTVLLILCNNDKIYSSSSEETYFQAITLHIP